MLRKRIVYILLVLALMLSLLPPVQPAIAAPGDPGKIEAESYSAMNGIQTEVCSEGGMNVAYTDIGDWMDYTVNVQNAGTYTVDFRVASPYADTQLQLRNGGTTLATVTVPNTGGWQTWQTVSATVNLSAGTQTLRIYAATNGWNLNWFSLTSSGAAQPVAAPTFTPGAGTYATAQNVTIATATAGASIKYTTDGSTPTAASPAYTGAINVASTKTLKAIATKAGMTDSAVSTATFTIGTSGNANLALNKSATASSSLTGGAASAAVDGSTTTRWESQFADPQWIYVDLGSNMTVGGVKLNWETASAKSYKIQVSTNASTWTDVYTQTNGAGAIETISFAQVSARYVRMYGTVRNTGYGYSLWEFEVYGQPPVQPSDVTIPITGPYAQYLEMGLSPADANQTTTLKAQNTTVNLTAKYPVGTSVTIGVNYMVEQKDVAFRTTDANGNTIKGNPLTFTVHANSAIAVEITDRQPTAVNLALNKSATASSAQVGSPATAAFDGNAATRWESLFSDPQWISVDLGSNNTVTGVKLNWETASAKTYKIQVSTDGTNWTDAYTQAFSAGGVENLTINPITARYVRLNGTVRNTVYGYSLWEFEVYGLTTPLPPKVATPTFTPAPGAYTTPQNVAIATATAGATIKYTTDGSVPTAASPTYTGPINITTNKTIRAIAVKADMTDSDAATAAYAIAAFKVSSPVNGQMVTNTRTPSLTWEAKAGTAKYEVYVNLTRNDYDWNASGNLLDRYTKVGETTGTTLNAPSLVDRWTYKWYVVAVDAGGNRSQSNIGQFSVYLPYIEQVADGVNIVNGSRDLNKNGTIEPYEDWHNSIDARMNDLFSRMTNDEKINQLFFSPESLDGLNLQAGFVFSYGVTGFITDAQKKMSAESRLGVPIGFTGDKVHGWKTIYPTELGLSATRNLNLIWQVGDLQRREQKAWGFTGTLSPISEVNTKVLYPRFQEGTGENADFSAAMLRAIIAGMQGGPEINPKSMMITVKHWPSQGAGGEQSIVYDSATIKWHMKPWYAAMDANPASVMPGYGGAPFLDPSGEGAGSSKPTLDYLRNVIGFNGIVMTDWLAAATDISVKSMNAGADVMGGAVASGTDFNTLISSVGWTRLNEAVRRVLELKFKLGMFENPYGDPDYPTTIWHSTESNNIVNEAARQSLTLLKNNGVLPLKPNNGDTIIVAGPRATSDDFATDNIANVIWQSIYHDNPAAKSYYQGIKDRAGTGVNVALNDAASAKAAVVVIGEKSYTHGTEWLDKSPVIPADQVAVIDKFYNRNIPVVCAIVMPRPYVLTDIVNKCSAMVALYRPGNGGGLATSQLLFGDYLPKGQLPFQLPRSVDQIGTDNVNNQLEKWDLPYDIGATEAQRTEIRNLINNNQPVPTTYGNPLYPYGYGLQNFNPSP
ncbi:galactose-binding domain-containing protein [Paenibacillus sp. MMS18-CY102]|uniref:galactose-binding domain-containing protein n=1 Tax=Paenibacillus sp. MMS18-CY102 TaxID=2682849 RepID=UPI0013664C74|nr:discoidin domain-containing protein [Paenibacillus sp. MMS18-CY102]